MTMRTFSIVLAVTLFIASGCSGKQSEESSKDNQQKEETAMVTKTQNEFFVDPEPMLAFEYEPVERSQPKSAEQAEEILKQMSAFYSAPNVPRALNRDLTRESAYEVAKGLIALEKQKEVDLRWLKAFDAEKIPTADQWAAQNLTRSKDSVISRLEEYLPRDMEHTLKYTRDFIDGSVSPLQIEFVRKAAEADMSNQNAVRNLLGRPMLNASRDKDIRRMLECFDAAILFDEMMGAGEGQSKYREQKADYRKLVNQYQDKLANFAEAIQPPTDIGDSNLTKIAKEVLANERYDLPEAVRVIVNAPKRSFSKDHYTIDFGEESITKDPYRWEEFQVATIEKEGDQYAMYYNTMIKYSVGPKTVPVEKWVLGPRHRSSLIAEANINN